MSTADEESLRQELRRRFREGGSVSGALAPAWPEPKAFRAHELSTESSIARARLGPPDGPMRAFVGERYPATALLDSDHYDESDLPVLERVTAYPVPALIGQSITVGDVDDIAPRLRELLGATLPGIDWWIREHWAGPFEKYGIVHDSMPAPVNEATGEPMSLELCGLAEWALQVGSDEWLEARKQWARNESAGDMFSVVRHPARVHIVQATWSNVRFPGIGVPLYL